MLVSVTSTFTANGHGLVDYFREIAGRTPPLACFLSHIHSDHIQGLDSLTSPFVYCSPATREVQGAASQAAVLPSDSQGSFY